MSTKTASAHPTPDLLGAWLEGDLPEKERCELEVHFESCAECRELAADLRGFAQLEDPSLTAADQEKILGKIRHQILAEEVAPDPFAVRPTPKPVPVRLPDVEPAPNPVLLHPAATTGRFFVPAWAAAALVLLFGGIAAQRQLELGRLARELATQGAKVAELETRLKEPLGNPFFIEARSPDDRQRSPSPPLGQKRPIVVTIVAILPEGTWRAEIENSGVPPISGLVPRAGQLLFLLPPGALAPGTYQVHLFRGEEPWPQVFELNL